MENTENHNYYGSIGQLLSLVRQNVWLCILTGVLTYLFYSHFIQPFFTPVRKIPGLPYIPFIGSMFSVTSGSAREMNTHKIKKIHDKYGPIARWYFLGGRERVSVADPDIFKHILVTNCKNYVKPKVRFMKVFKWIIGEGLILLEGAEHATHKRLMGPSFNNNSIKKMIPVFEKAGRKLTNHWRKQIKQSGKTKARVPIQIELSHTTLDVIGETAFGYDCNSLENPDDPVNQAFQRILEGQGISPLILLPYFYQSMFAATLRNTVAVMHNKVLEIIDYKRRLISQGEATENTANDILSIMMLARDEETGQGLSDAELKNETMTLMSAGHETTSTAMAWFLLCLANHPEVQKKCQEEVMQYLPSSDTQITWEVLDKMNYLECTIKETMRLYPPVPQSIRMAQKSDQFGQYYIPAGTVVTLSIAAMMRSKRLFENADEFNPDRFSTSDDENKNMYRFLPFLIGPRMCLGYKFALLETKAILACLLRELNFELIPGTKFRRCSANRITMRPHPSLELNVSHI